MINLLKRFGAKFAKSRLLAFLACHSLINLDKFMPYVNFLAQSSYKFSLLRALKICSDKLTLITNLHINSALAVYQSTKRNLH
ncbi:hypothetical protein B9N60_04635 [Campylobacter concisus]|uniref:Uncharacterized protein n=1 Tax=Campylobacter concisus TaxID=199 RepID=A0A1Y5N9P0_9BACT|nr:hypothetical protein B9N60_04635 [Campylobacter concisus]